MKHIITQITPEIIAGTPVSNIRGIEWYQTLGGWFARVVDRDSEWRVFVAPASRGWAAHLWAANPEAPRPLVLRAKTDEEARTLAVGHLKSMRNTSLADTRESWARERAIDDHLCNDAAFDRGVVS